MSFSTFSVQAPRPAARALTQRGGTVLGIIVGIVLGLAAALAVAIYVAQVPVPFINKNNARSTGQDAAEAERNRNWDPNGTLRGRGTARPEPAPSQVARGTVTAPATSPSAPASAARTTTSRPVPAPAEVRTAEASAPSQATRAPAATPSGDPLGELAMARAAAAPSPAPAPAATPAPGGDPFTYFVQAGAFRSAGDAEAQRARLSLMGVQARVTEREQAGRTVYRVRVGPFQNKDAADRVKERLDSDGFDSALVRVQR